MNTHKAEANVFDERDGAQSPKDAEPEVPNFLGNALVRLKRLPDLERSFEHRFAQYRNTIGRLVIEASRVSPWPDNIVRKAREFLDTTEAAIHNLDSMISGTIERRNAELNVVSAIQHDAGRLIAMLRRVARDKKSQDDQMLDMLELGDQFALKHAVQPHCIVVGLRLSHNPSVGTLGPFFIALDDLFKACGADSLTLLHAREGTLKIALKAYFRDLFSLKTGEEVARTLTRDVYDHLTNTAAEKRKTEAETSSTQIECKLKELELALRSDPTEQQLNLLITVCKAKQAVEDVRQAEIRTALMRQDLIERTKGEIRETLEQQQAYALSFDSDNESFGIVGKDGRVIWRERDEVIADRAVAGTDLSSKNVLEKLGDGDGRELEGQTA